MNKPYQAGFLRHVLLLLGCLLGLLVIAALVVTLLRIPLDLARYKPLVESSVSDALGREVSIDGDIVVTTSLWPYFEIHGLRIANPAGLGAGDLASMDLARVSVGLLPLLQRKIRIREFRVSGLALDLVRHPEGGGNWMLEGVARDSGDAGKTAAVPDTPDQSGAIAADALSVDQLLLEDIRVSYRDGEAAPLAFVMERAEGAAAVDDPMQLSMQGNLLQEAFTLEIEANSLADFLAMTRSQLGMELNIAGARFAFSGLSEALRGGRETELQVVVEGANLSSMDDLLRLDLPPLADYRLRADLHAVPGQLRLTALEARVKDSVLRGSMLVDKTGEKPFVTMDLTAELIQLKDFDTGDWTAEGTEAAAADAEAAEASAEGEETVERAKVLSPEALARADATLTLKVAEVLSGDDSLGSGELQLSLKNGRLDLDPLQLKLPRASLLVQASVKPGLQTSEAALRVLLQNFDFGVLARLSDPRSEVGGTLSADIDVTAAASNTRNILSGANGYLDISGHPENFRSGMVDLWAVNLLSAVVTSSAKAEGASEINCLIGRFSLTDGVMTADNLAADTSKIRICGKGKISFVDNSFNLVARPKAKRPEFFSLATPLAVRGEFDDFRIGMKAGVLTLGTTATKFVISPITTPFRRVFKRDLPENGADICGLPIGPHKGELEPLPGC